MKTLKNISFELFLILIIVLSILATRSILLSTAKTKAAAIDTEAAQQYFFQYCSEKVNWTKEAVGVSISARFSGFGMTFDPENYILTYSPIVLVEDTYQVEFLGKGMFGIYDGAVSSVTNKNTSQEIQGKERDRIVKAAIEKVKGQTFLSLTHHVAHVDGKSQNINFSCSIP